MEIAEFLLARIAEDEAAAREMVKNKRWLGECGEPHDERIQIGDWTFDGDRLLAKCAADRLIAEAHRDGDTDPYVTSWVLCCLALPYTDHEHYDPEWKL